MIFNLNFQLRSLKGTTISSCDSLVFYMMKNMNIKNYKTRLVVFILEFLAKASPPLPKTMAMRFKKSAKKRRNFILTYQDVLAAWGRQRREQLPEAVRLVENLRNGPMFSVVVPVFNPRPDLLAKMIESIQAQSYKNWELCLADDCSTDTNVHNMLRKFAREDNRINVIFRKENGHISAATNSAIEIAKGDFIVFVDHDDIIDPDSLLLAAKEIVDRPHVKIIYSDQDLISVDDVRSGPFFKPDFDRLLICEHNYVSHLGVYDADLVRKVGGCRIGLEGSQDHDMLLRCIEHITDDQVYHIPKILYSWRTSPGSAAHSSDAKPYAAIAGRRAVEEHLRRTTNTDIVVEHGSLPFTYCPKYQVSGTPLVSIIMPTRDHLAVTRTAVESVLDKTSYKNYEILIVDNGSIEEPTLKWFKHIQAHDHRVRVLRDDRPFNYSSLNNNAAKHANGDYIVLLNNDVEIISGDWLSEMLALAQRDKAGCIGAKLYYPDGRIQHAGVIVGLGGVAGHVFSLSPSDAAGYGGRLKLRNTYTAVTAACLLISKPIFEEVGGLNEHDLKIAFNDIDFCLKVAKAGYKNAWTPYAELTHHESLSRGYEDSPEKKARLEKEADYMIAKWKTDIFEDPAYNVNLTKDRDDYSFGRPVWKI